MPVYLEEQAYCKNCGRSTLVRGRGVNHVLHLIVSLLCCWPWLFVWALLCLTNAPDWRCNRCGSRCRMPTGAIKTIGGLLLAVGLGLTVGGIFLAVVYLKEVPENRPGNQAVPDVIVPEGKERELDAGVVSDGKQPLRRKGDGDHQGVGPNAETGEKKSTPREGSLPRDGGEGYQTGSGKSEAPLANAVTLTPAKGETVLLAYSRDQLAQAANSESRKKLIAEGKLLELTQPTVVDVIYRGTTFTELKYSGKSWVVESRHVPSVKK